MKVYRVTTQRDGETSRVPGKVSTEILQDDYYYAAKSIEAVWGAISWLRADAERTVVGVLEVLPSLDIVLEAEAETK